MNISSEARGLLAWEQTPSCTADTLFSNAEHCVHGMQLSIRCGAGEQACDFEP
jgi:hypothetical protein